MSLIIQLPAEVEAELSAAAKRLGMDVERYAAELLAAQHPGMRREATGRDVVEFWRNEGVVGMRTDVADAQGHARSLRTRAERRIR